MSGGVEMRLAGICLVWAVMGMAYAQTAPVSPPAEVNGWKLEAKHETYNYDTIFDYIDGIGEVYRAYNMRAVWVFRYHRTDQPSLTVDLFEMASPEDAYGIFSFERDGEDAHIGQGSDYAVGMLRFWKERFFVVITAERESDEVRRAILHLGRAIADAVPRTAPLPHLVRVLPSKGITSKAPLFFRHPMILNRHFFVADENILNLSPQAEGVLATYGTGNARMRLVLVRYPTEAEAAKALQTFSEAYLREGARRGIARTENRRWTAVKRKGRLLVVVFDAPTRQQAQQMLSNVRLTDKEVQP